jgi:aspartyl-tRNA(Asn)/glutamyl-tRNA(Gln) amidotransferase subunit C
MPVSISEKDVRHIAKLANLALKDDEVARMTQELGAIVAYVEQLSEVDTNNVEPIAQITGLVNVTRADEPGPMFAQRQALANAPKADEIAFLVPKTVER